MEATEKQISFAKSLGISNPESFTKMALKEMIDKKLKERDANKPIAQPSPISAPISSNQVGRHDIVIQRTEKPHSYEFGPAKSRFKIYYNEVTELKAHIEMLKQADLYFEDDFSQIETQKIN